MKRLCLMVVLLQFATKIFSQNNDDRPISKQRLDVLRLFEDDIGVNTDKALPNTRRRVQIHHPPEQDGDAFESDIVMTKEQSAEIARDLLHGNRKRRKAITDSTKIWPKGILVYKYDDLFPNDRTVKSNIAKAMKMWEDTTCLRFQRQTPTTASTVGHSSVINILYGRQCQSSVGRQTYMQELEVGGECKKMVGSLAHELAHAAGLYHEHTRPDRDNHIDVYPDHIKPPARAYFRKHGIPSTEHYDVESIMHYGSTFFSKDQGKPLYTILSKDRRLMGEMGQRSHLSFIDIKTVNDLYNCNRNCPKGLACQNGGYIGPNCACACPIGLTGIHCTDVVRSTSADCGGILTSSSGTFTSPGGTRAKYPSKSSCTWLIQGPPGSSIQLQFTKMDVEGEDSQTCFYDYVEVKRYGPTLPGPRYCNANVHGGKSGVIQYQGNSLLVYFHSDEQYNYYGFEAKYTIH